MPSSHFGRIGAVASLLRKEACSGSIRDLAHNPTQNCLADCLTKASAKADNLFTAVKRGRLLDVDIHADFSTLMEHKAFFIYLVQNIHAHKGQGSFLLEQSQDLSCTNSPRTTFSGDVCADSTDQRAKGIEYACERKGQDATKITSDFADSCIQFLWSVMPIPMKTLTWMRKNTPTRNTIEVFTAEIDEAGFVRQYNFFHL